MIAMIENFVNPWSAMHSNSIRRVDSEIIHDLFWMKDQLGNYCFYIKSKKEFLKTDIDINLKGLTLIKRNTDYKGELFLIINKQSDWELFLTICNDIIFVCSSLKNNEEMITSVENRLKHWQLFLMHNTDISFPLISQMGLFGELIVLKDILIPNVGITPALLSWVGPDLDKQDFSLSNVVIEVKSYISSKGPKVTISSAHQLFSHTKPLYLVAIGLTHINEGQSVIDLIDEINSLINFEDFNILRSFEQKLLASGFMQGLKYSNLYKFNIDSSRVFEVRDTFPRLLPHQINNQIIALNYTIDLQLCTEFEGSIQTLIDNF